MGWDAFGLPAEDAAIERGVHPHAWTHENIDAMRQQLRGMGLSYAWRREVATCDQSYYRHEPTVFHDFLIAALAYSTRTWGDWNPVENTATTHAQVNDPTR